MPVDVGDPQLADRIRVAKDTGLANGFDQNRMWCATSPRRGGSPPGYSPRPAKRDPRAGANLNGYACACYRPRRPSPDRASGRAPPCGQRAFVAYLVAAEHGLATDDYTFAYVAGWAADVDQTRPEDVVRDTQIGS